MLQGSNSSDVNEMQSNDGGPQFAEVFVIYWLGAAVVTLNIKLLGGSMLVLHYTKLLKLFLLLKKKKIS